VASRLPCLAEAAAGAHQFAGDPLGIVRSEERGDTSNIIHLTDTAKRGLGDDAFLEVRAGKPAVCRPSVSTMPGLMELTFIRGSVAPIAAAFLETAEFG
jgi:hypothetical protein